MGETYRVQTEPTSGGPNAPVKEPVKTESKPDEKTPAANQPAPAERPAHIPEKFWKEGRVDVDALVKSYAELERFKSKPADQPKSETPKGDEKPKDGEPKADEKTPKGDEKPKEEQKTEEQSSIPGVTKADSDRFTQEFTTDGKLSDQSYEQLAKSGYPKDVVDAYIRGIQSEQSTTIADIKSVAGGDAGYTAMTDWMSASLSDADLSAYNEAVTSGKPAVVKMAVKAMHQRYKTEGGTDPNLLTGQGNNAPKGDVFTSRAEVSAAMKDRRYSRDAAYRKSVEEKLGRSAI